MFWIGFVKYGHSVLGASIHSLSTKKIAHDFMAQFLAKRRFLLQYDMESFKNSKTRHFEEAPFQFCDQVTLNQTKTSSYLISN